MPSCPTISPRAANVICIIFLILLPLCFFWRQTLGWLTLGDQDAVFWFFPAYKFFAEQVKAGNLPIWSPYLYSGTPLFAQWQAGMLDPINWIYLVEVTSRTLTLSLEASFAISLLATFTYTRSLGFKRRASICAALIYALSGFAVGRVLYPGFLHIIALTPLVLFFIERLSQRRNWRDAVGGALIITWQIFAAHPQPLVYSSLLAGFYALFKLKTIDGGAVSFRNRVLFLTQFTIMFIAGAGLASIQLIPAWEAASQSVRQKWPYELFTLHSLHPVSLLTTLFPFFQGEGRGLYQMPYWGIYWHHNEAQIYLGLPAISLAIAGATYAWRSRDRTGIFWSLAALAGVILAIGKYSGPVARILYHVPLISQFRSPNRHWMEVVLGVAVLSGYAVDRLLREDARALVRDARVTAIALALLCCGVGGFVLWRKDWAEMIIRRLPDLDQIPQGFLRSSSTEFYLPVIAAAIGCAGIIIFSGSLWRGRLSVLLIAFLFFDFNLYATFAPISSPANLEASIGKAVPAELVSREDERRPFRYHSIHDPLTGAAGEFSPFWFYGRESAAGYDPLMNERYKTFSGVDEAGRSYLSSMLEARDRTLDLLNVRYIFIPPDFSDLNSSRVMVGAALNDTGRWRELSARSPAEPYRDFRVFENLNLLPRAWLVDQAKPAYEGDQLKLIRGETASTGDREFDPRTTVLVDHETAQRLDQGFFKKAAPSGGAVSLPFGAEILERNPTRMMVRANAQRPSVLVLSEIAGPGWKAKIDGREGDLIRVNYDLRGVILPAGEHLIEITYCPRSLKIGAAVSLTTALCLLILGLWEKRSSK